MFSLFPSAYPQSHASYYDDEDYSYGLAQWHARERRDAQRKAQLDEARRSAYQRHLAGAETARRRSNTFLDGFGDEPHSSLLQPAAARYLRSSNQHFEGTTVPHRERLHLGHTLLEDLMQQQTTEQGGECGDQIPRNLSESMSATAIPTNEPVAKKKTACRSSSPTSDDRDVAARKLQVFVRTQIPRLRAFRAIADISRQFEAIKATIEFPSALDFANPPAESDGVPTLLFTPRNAPLHGHEHALVKLLSKLDAVDSHEDDRIRKARKQLVKRIESELGVIDAKKVAVWKEAAAGSVGQPKVVSSGDVPQEPQQIPLNSVESIRSDVDHSPAGEQDEGVDDIVLAGDYIAEGDRSQDR